MPMTSLPLAACSCTACITGENRATAPVRVHEGAVYLHEGRSFVVSKLDWDNALVEVQAAEVAQYRELGAIDVIHKPFDPMELSAQISHIWAQRGQ